MRGLDLNQRPPGYEPREVVSRLCLSTTYVDVVVSFFTIFAHNLFATCSSRCSPIEGHCCERAPGRFSTVRGVAVGAIESARRHRLRASCEGLGHDSFFDRIGRTVRKMLVPLGMSASTADCGKFALKHLDEGFHDRRIELSATRFAQTADSFLQRKA